MIDVCPNPLVQAAVAEMCKGGFLDEHIKQLRSIYKSRCSAMLSALERYMPDGVSWTKPKGGFYIWVTLPKEVDAMRMLDSALENKVTYVIGSGTFADGSGKNTFRISFCHETEDIIDEGIKRLGNTVKQTIGKK